MAQINDNYAGQTAPEQRKSIELKDSEIQDVHVENSNEIFTYTSEEEKRVKSKIDSILLPLLCMCYVFSVW